MTRKLLVCYVPGLDVRLVSESKTPAIAGLLGSFSPVSIRTIPDTELVPTLLSGVYPHQNMIWQVSLDVVRRRTASQRLIDLLPGPVTTTVQCVRQKFNPEFDLATIPPRRRRDFVQHRFKYTRRAADPESLQAFNGHKTIFGALGGDSCYRFTSDFSALEAVAQEALSSSLRFELIEMYALDLYQHWHLDNDEGMCEALARTDQFVERLLEGCSESGQTLVLLSDHGQEPVVGTIPLLDELRTSGVPESDYSYYCELACCRLWFHTEPARQTILEMMKSLPKCRPLHYRDMHRYEIRFDDDRFGEYYVMADAGYIFFPHDFYHPIANVYLGLFGNSQRSRIVNPVHRGNHGYLPHNPSERGFMVLADPGVESNCDSMSLIDFAPTMLSYLGADVPRHMTGRCVVA